MEFFTLILTSLFTLVSPAGIALDTLAEQNIRDRLFAAEKLEVRIDNTPSYQLLNGKVDRLRIAGRGLSLIPGLRLDILEIETDPIDVNPRELGRGSGNRPVRGLQQPLQAAVRVAVTEADLNTALQSPELYNQMQTLALSLFDSPLIQQIANRYTLVDRQVTFLPNNRVRFQTKVQERGYNDFLTLTVETGINVIEGQQLQLISPSVWVNDRPAPRRLVTGLLDLTRRFNLQRLETRGVRSQVLQFNLTPAGAEIALFLAVNP
ncbi:DUF2993 domain-containing protein [Oscillatoria sp. HE19RPO]|uniref:LmeA family phospholipid-binding protein n=1 Tax=Oscillatoria sp. HE19RPO TaxID=2954806 RepID=UPI0020C24292|nr:DUF2993 domain-containing protein [Oscillatoria sp. HE19RPO]